MSDFTEQCDELGRKVTELLFAYPKDVAICVLPGVIAAIAVTFDVPRNTVIAMLDAALEDIEAAA